MKDTIELVDEMGEAEELGWTCLGRVHRDDCWQETGWVYCKKDKFAVFNEAGPDMQFLGYLDKGEAMEELFTEYHKSITAVGR